MRRHASTAIALLSFLSTGYVHGFLQLSIQSAQKSVLSTPRAELTRFQRGTISFRRESRGLTRVSADIKCQESGTEERAGSLEVSAPVVRAASSSTSVVPTNMEDAVKVFWAHPTPQAIAVVIAASAISRVFLGPLGFEDLVAAVVIVVAWIFQEWAMHRYLLHSEYDWLGARIHKNHHATEYFHVCIDELTLAGPWTAVAAVFFLALLPVPTTVGLTCLLAYTLMGLHYEWSHYLAHTKAVPSMRLWKQSKRAHTKHHLADDSLWFGFTLPAIDDFFDTAGEYSREE